MWTTHMCKEIPTSHVLTIPWLPFKHLAQWVYFTSREVNYHPKSCYCMLRIYWIPYQILCHWVIKRKRFRISQNIYCPVTFEPKFYRNLEKVKIVGLKHHYNNSDKEHDIPNGEKTVIQCWISNTDNAHHHTFTHNPYHYEPIMNTKQSCSSVWHLSKNRPH